MRAALHACAFLACLFGTISVSSAAIISGTHHTDGGKLVNLQGLEWLSWDETVGVSRTAIEAGHNNLLADGWRYASRSELAILFQSLSPISGENTANHDGTQWLWKTFDNPSFNAPAGWGYSRSGNLHVGLNGEGASTSTVGYYAHWRAYSAPATYGWMYDSFGRSATFNTLISKDYSGTNALNTSEAISSVLVREAAVPEPATMTLWGLGALGCAAAAYRRRKRAV